MILLYTDPNVITPEEWQFMIGMILITFGLWLLRKTPLGFLWTIYKWFWIILFATLFLNYAKKEFKSWWNKD